MAKAAKPAPKKVAKKAAGSVKGGVGIKQYK
jgi:hypothetical protein